MTALVFTHRLGVTQIWRQIVPTSAWGRLTAEGRSGGATLASNDTRGMLEAHALRRSRGVTRTCLAEMTQ
jgi:hypothetical protein